MKFIDVYTHYVLLVYQNINFNDIDTSLLTLNEESHISCHPPLHLSTVVILFCYRNISKTLSWIHKASDTLSLMVLEKIDYLKKISLFKLLPLFRSPV